MELREIDQLDNQNNIEKVSEHDTMVTANIDDTIPSENPVCTSPNNGKTVAPEIASTPMIATLSTQIKTPHEMLNYTPGGSEEWVNVVEMEYTPKVGMEFTTLQKGIDFYFVYAVACGFTPRRNTIKRFRDRVIRTNEVVCNREGHPRDRKTEKKIIPKVESTKTLKVRRYGCRAKIKFRYDKGKYVVDQFYEAHNHKLTLVKNREFHKLVRNVSLYHKKTIINNLKMNIGATKTYRICKEQSEGYENVGATLVDFKNFQRDVKCFIGGKDAQMFINNFQKLTETRKGFYFAYEVDGEQNINRVFWADPEARRYYSVFGDAVSYDPTYGTNKYCMVFTPFTGIDNHKKSVCFGAALLKNEDEESFKWTFEKFLDCMGGREPQFIITDQDPAIKKAVSDVFKTARHRLCMWHIMSKVTDKVGSVICKDTNFLSRINYVVWDADLEPIEFEVKWKEVISEFGLDDNDWLKTMYEMRDHWIPAYFRDMHMGSILRTTQRSESANSFFKMFENHYGTFVEFWMRFVSAMEQQRHAHKQLELESMDTLPKKISHLYIEDHALRVYTHEAFFEIQQEIKYSSSSCSVAGFSNTGQLEVTTVQDATRNKRYEVQYNAETNDASCSCKLFDRRGLLCRHIIWVYSGKRLKTIPERYIVTRWTKNALKNPIYDMDGNLLESYDKTDVRKIEMCKVWAEIYATVGVVATKEPSDMINLVKLLKEFREKLEPTKEPLSKEQEMEMLLGCSVPKEVNIFPPIQAKNKGSGKRLVSKKNEAIENSKRKKRVCQNCKQMAHHDRRTCTNPFVKKAPEEQVQSESDLTPISNG